MPPSPRPSTLSPAPSKAHSPRSPLAPHFEDPPDPDDERPDPHQTDDAVFDADDEIPYPEPGSEHTLLPPPNFNPFFTIVEDTTTGDHHHPFVHYVFADDDPVIVTAAAMRSLGLDDTKFLPRPDVEPTEAASGDEDGDDREPPLESPLPPPIIGTKERFMIVDIAADGHTIVSAQSMSPDWQITEATVRTAPSFDEGAPDRGYMLKIAGVQVATKNKGKGKGQPGDAKLREAQEKSQGDVFRALDTLVQGVEGNLEMATRISGRDEEVKESGQTAVRIEQADTGGSRRGSRVDS